jgi:O-antigen ligase
MQVTMKDIVDIYFPEGIFMLAKIIAFSDAVFLWMFLHLRKKIELTRFELYWLVFAVAILLYNNGDIQNGEWVSAVFFTATIILTIILTCTKDWIGVFMGTLKIFTMINAIATILFFISPGLYNAYEPLILKTTKGFYTAGYTAGITRHYSLNGVILSLGSILCFTELLSRKRKKFETIILFLVEFLALILTTKRAHFLFTGVAMCVIYFLLNRKFTTVLKIILGTFAAGGLLLFLSNFIPELGFVINRFFGQSDISNGRFYVYAMGFKMFRKSPIFGHGWNQFIYTDASRYLALLLSGESYAYIQMHNVYLQLLYEVGIVGFILVISLLAGTLIRSIRFQKSFYIDAKKISERENKYLVFSIAYQIFFLCYCITGNPLYDAMAYIPYFFSCGIYFTIFKRYSRAFVSHNAKINLVKPYSR